MAESAEAAREDRRSRGLQTILARAEFDELLRNVAAAVRVWRDFVTSAQSVESMGLPFLGVRYEDLLVSPAATLEKVFEFMGAPITSDECEAIADEFQFETMRSGGQQPSGIAINGELSGVGKLSEPEGFYRRGTNGGWIEEWNTRECGEFDRVAGSLLISLGYETSPEWWNPSLIAPLARSSSAVRELTREKAKKVIRTWVMRQPSLAGR